jgi:hypothetical protein
MSKQELVRLSPLTEQPLISNIGASFQDQSIKFLRKIEAIMNMILQFMLAI